MAAKLLDDKRDYLVNEHRAGRSAGELASEFGVTHKVIVRILGSDYIAIGRPANILPEEAIAMYVGGASENAVAKYFDVSRRAVTALLEKAGVERRNASAAETLKWSQMSSEKRANQVKAANVACRGRKADLDELCKRAKGREGNLSFASHYESQLRNMLYERIVAVIPQTAIGPYNCDLAAFPVAVEVWGGKWHFGGKHAERTPKRFRYLMEEGWNILAVVVSSRFPLTTAVADYVAAYVKQFSGKPSLFCEYRVVWGAGEFSTGGSMYDDEITFVPPFTSRRNPTTGQYETIPR